MHIHVVNPDGEAKFWLEPIVALAKEVGLSPKQLNEIQDIIEAKNHEIKNAWKKHFRS